MSAVKHRALIEEYVARHDMAGYEPRLVADWAEYIEYEAAENPRHLAEAAVVALAKILPLIREAT